LEIRQEQAEAVRLIYAMYLKGSGASEIAKELYRRRTRSYRGNTAWGRAMIMKILKCETYAGTWHYNKTIAAPPRTIRKPEAVRRRLNTVEHRRPQSEWVAIRGIPAIIDEVTFAAAQHQLERNRQFCRRNRRRHYLLAGLVRCAVCGRACDGTSLQGGKYLYYRCMGNFRFGELPAVCKSRPVPLKRVDGAVWSTVWSSLSSPATLLAQIVAVRQDFDSDLQAARRDRERLAEQLAQTKCAESRLLEAYSDGTVTLEQLRAQMERIKQRRELFHRNEEPGKHPTPHSLDEATLADICDKVTRGLDILGSDFERRQQFLRTIVDKVLLSYDAATIIGSLPVDSGARPALGHTLDAGLPRSRKPNKIIRFELFAKL
jgi:site-specific DNA recombinase